LTNHVSAVFWHLSVFVFFSNSAYIPTADIILTSSCHWSWTLESRKREKTQQQILCMDW